MSAICISRVAKNVNTHTCKNIPVADATDIAVRHASRGGSTFDYIFLTSQALASLLFTDGCDRSGDVQ